MPSFTFAVEIYNDPAHFYDIIHFSQLQNILNYILISGCANYLNTSFSALRKQSVVLA